MKKKLLLVLAVVLTCAVGVAAAVLEPGDPEPVAALLSQHLEKLDKGPGGLRKSQSSVLEGVRYVLPFSGGELQLYAYRTEDAAAQDLLTVSEDGGRVGSICVEWEEPPHFFLRDNVIVLYVGEDWDVLNMLDRLCGAQIRGEPLPL